MKNLRTLILIDCNGDFILALDPKKNSAGPKLRPGLEELVIYTGWQSIFRVELFTDMVKNRASRAAKLSSITITNPRARSSERVGMFKFAQYATRVECRISETLPEWDDASEGK